ncbi:hypothetical protein LJR175_000991 [Variovorax sp. LjRoot175]|uniref:hypothetical protein n=1 Tax=Variovorax sp. LjRoot175 TaxID=3342276 RepID=UPI003ECEACA4
MDAMLVKSAVKDFFKEWNETLSGMDAGLSLLAGLAAALCWLALKAPKFIRDVVIPWWERRHSGQRGPNRALRRAEKLSQRRNGDSDREFLGKLQKARELYRRSGDLRKLAWATHNAVLLVSDTASEAYDEGKTIELAKSAGQLFDAVGQTYFAAGNYERAAVALERRGETSDLTEAAQLRDTAASRLEELCHPEAVESNRQTALRLSREAAERQAAIDSIIGK